MGSTFRILGPLEVDDAPALGGPKPRTLLARLLLEPNRVVAEDELIDTLWGEDPPEQARHALRVYVSSLRRALGPDRIRRGRGGYAVVVGLDEVDLGRFERLAAEGADLLRAGDAVAARGRLEEALSLWRGPALADVAPGLEGERARLEELRLAALESRLDADLALGRHADLVPELEALTAAEPLRERLRAQLMLALYRSGRQADALAVYRDARQALDELGVEPSAALRELEAAVLRQDALLAVEPPELRARRRLPAPATVLVGRRREVEEVGRLLRGEARLVTLTGPGGTGKTRVALQAAHELADRFPDGVVFVGLAALRDPALVPAEIAAALELDGAQPSSEQALVAHLRQRAMLLVVDNFEQVDDAAPVLAALLSAVEQLRLLVTSRQPLRLYGEHELPVPPLDDDDGVALFSARARAVRPSFTASAAVGELCARLDRLPLAIELAAAKARELSAQELLDTLPKRLELAAGGPRDLPARQQTLRATIEWSFDLLSAREQALFRALGVFAGGCTTGAAETVCDADLAELTSLARKSLLQRTTDRFSMLETIREYALERLESDGVATEVTRRHAEYFLDLALAGESVRRQPGEIEWMNRLDAERDNLRAAFAWLLEHEPESAARFAEGAFRFWYTRGHFDEGAFAFERVLDSTHLEGREEANLRSYAAAFAFGRRDLARARKHAERSLELQRPLGDDVALARILVLLGTIRCEEGASADAVPLLDESVLLARASGVQQVVAFALQHLALALLYEGEHDRFLPLATEALELARIVGSRDAECGVVCAIAQSALLQGDIQEARRRFAVSLPLAVELGDPVQTASALQGLAYVAATEGDPARGARLYGGADALVSSRGLQVERLDRELADRAAEALRNALGEDTFREQAADGGSLDHGKLVAEALEIAQAATTRP